MSVSVLLVFFALLVPPDSLVVPDSGRREDRVRPTASLDFRNSFLERQRVNVWGVNAGIEFGPKRHQLTLGYYWLNYATYLRLINWQRDAAQRINLDYYTRTDLWFTSLQYRWNMTNNRRWMVSIPVELGGGVAYAVPRDLNQDVQIDRTRMDFFLPIQVGIYAQWKATRWVGLRGQIGYRYSVFQTDINQNFNGAYYSVGLALYPTLLTDMWRLATKGDRISPVRPPRPRKNKN